MYRSPFRALSMTLSFNHCNSGPVLSLCRYCPERIQTNMQRLRHRQEAVRDLPVQTAVLGAARETVPPLAQEPQSVPLANPAARHLRLPGDDRVSDQAILRNAPHWAQHQDVRGQRAVWEPRVLQRWRPAQRRSQELVQHVGGVSGDR